MYDAAPFYDARTTGHFVHEHRVVRSSQAAALPPTVIGGKAANLARLERAGLPIPPWFCLTAAVFHDVTAAAAAAVADELARFDPADAGTADRISKEISTAIHATGLPADDRSALHEYYRHLAVDSPLVAVRSSAADEDSEAASFAGQMDSYLFVPEHDLDRRVLDCFASCFSPRALAYRKIHGRAPVHDAGVIVQQMIDSHVSGVLFTANPTTGDHSETVVCAAIGVGEGVVADRAEADTFVVESTTLAVRRREVVPKRSRVVFDAAHGAGTATAAVADADARRSSLDEGQIAALTRLGRAVESLFGRPQDIEWAIDGRGRIHVLQARPITSLTPASVTIFDNANIVESYPGLSLPLTFSVVRGGYERTFRAASRTIGVTESVLRANQAVHANLVALINGSIYYNLLNFYKLFLFVPGFEGALPAWEQALGLQGVTPPRPAPPTSLAGRLHARWMQLRVVRRLAWHFIRLDRSVREFHRGFETTRTAFKRRPLDRADAHELLELYEEVVANVSEPYSISVVNDAFVQQAYALLAKLIVRWKLGEPALRNDLLANEGVMQSLLPVRSLIELADEIRNDPALKKLFATRPAAEIWDRIRREDAFSPFHSRVVRHIEEYGDRTFQELKLETPSAEEAPELVIELLRNYASDPGDDAPRTGRKSGQGLLVPAEERRRAAERALASRLAGHPLRRAIFAFVLRRCRRMVAHREDMRLARSRAFGMAKRIVRALGRRMTQAGLIDQPQDLFYLGIEEITGAVRGASLTRDLRVLVAQRRAEYEVFTKLPLPSRVTARGLVLSSIANAAAPTETSSPDVRELRGIGCSAGRTRARARVVRAPEQHLDIRGEILVAPMTDPGWVFLMVPAGGLIVERGSVLSHTAIIGRELGIPTIVGVPDATSKIADGQLLEIDGTTGIVRLLD